MSAVFYVLAVWFFASVPTALLLGRACGLNDLSADGGELPLVDARASSQTELKADRHRRQLDAAA
jgi:hypothetical protein